MDILLLRDYFRVFTSVDGAISHKIIALALSSDIDNLGRLCTDQKSIKKFTTMLYGKGERKIEKAFREVEHYDVGDKYFKAYGFCSLMLHDTKTNTIWMWREGINVFFHGLNIRFFIFIFKFHLMQKKERFGYMIVMLFSFAKVFTR